MVTVVACETGGATQPTLAGAQATTVLASIQDQRELPFRAHLEGVGTVPDDPNRCAPLVTAGNATTGTMTHLGRVTGAHSQCIDPTGEHQNPLAFTNGIVTFTASNGTKLFATFAGVLQPTDEPGVFAAANPFQIVGGTGRFEGATGGGRATGSLDLRVPETPLVLDLDGTLVLPQ
jgi:hypothetical protein